jgi:diguanylate cyclase (GGDEF)-like protein
LDDEFAEQSIKFPRLRVGSWDRSWGIGARLSVAFTAVATLAIASNLLIQHEISVIRTTRLVRVEVPIAAAAKAPTPAVIPQTYLTIQPSADASIAKSLSAAIEHYEVAVRAHMGAHNGDGGGRLADALAELEQESRAYFSAYQSESAHTRALRAKLLGYRAHGDGLVQAVESRRSTLKELWETFDALNARTQASLAASWKIFGRVIAHKPLVDLNSNLDEMRREFEKIDPQGFDAHAALDAVETNEAAIKASLERNESLLSRSQGTPWLNQMQADLAHISVLQKTLEHLDRQRRERELSFSSESKSLMAEVRAAVPSISSPDAAGVPIVRPIPGPPTNVAPSTPAESVTDTSETTTTSREKPPGFSPIFWISAVVLAALLWISIRTVMSVITPVRRIRAATARIAGGETAVRVVNGGIRELDELATSFNQMAEQLTQAKATALAYQEQLEVKVELRTRELRHLAGHDPLTDLPNRRELFTHLKSAVEQAQSRTSHVAVFFVDLDNFKNVNDSMGHAFGDRVLSAIADRLLQCSGAAAFAARLGGDEFTIVRTEFASLKEVTDFGQDLVLAFQKPLVVDGRYLTISISVGSSWYPDHGRDPETLLRAADAALFRAKVLGRSQSNVFSSTLLDAASTKFSIEQGLRRALEHGEFELMFQPEIDAATLTPHLVEALLRWRMPDGRWALPGEFLGIAEESGLIMEISDWVLQKSVETASKWHHGKWPGARIAINLSSRQLLDPRFVDRVSALLREHRLPAHCIEIELTENILQTGAATIEVLRELRNQGIAIALDDFGIGYSSLASLEQLPLSRVKLDRMLVAGIHTSPRSAVVARSLVALCHNLGLAVTAEGIECVEQLALLVDLQPIYLQGFLLAQPMLADKVPSAIDFLPGHMASLMLLRPSKPGVDLVSRKHSVPSAVVLRRAEGSG